MKTRNTRSLSFFFALCAVTLPAESSSVADAADDVMGDAYRAIWNEAEQARIDADIEKNRKADGVFEIDAPDGAEVRIEQLSHAFRFGAHIFNFNQLGSTAANDAYKASYGAGGLFNQATVSFYWIDHELTPGAFRFGGGYEDSERFWNSLTREEAMRERHWRRPAPGPVIDFLRARDVAVHGHVLVWGQATPYWVYDWHCPEREKRVLDELGIPRHSAHLGFEPAGQNWGNGFQGRRARAWRDKYPSLREAGLDETALAERIPVFAANLRRLHRKRVFDVAAAYGDAADSWDVVNESAGDFSQYGASRTGLPLWFGWFGLMPGDYPLHALLDAGEAFPEHVKFAVNDANLKPYYVEQVKDLEKEGARIDIVGCQMHIFDTNACARLAAGATNVNWVGSPQIIRDRLDRSPGRGARSTFRKSPSPLRAKTRAPSESRRSSRATSTARGFPTRPSWESRGGTPLTAPALRASRSCPASSRATWRKSPSGSRSTISSTASGERGPSRRPPPAKLRFAAFADATAWNGRTRPAPPAPNGSNWNDAACAADERFAKTVPAASHSCDCRVAFLRLRRSVGSPIMNCVDARFEPPALLPHPSKRNPRRLP